MGKVQVMGTGCRKCRQLYENAVEALGSDNVEYETAIAAIAAAGIMTTPALVVDGKPLCVGIVPSAQEIKALVV